VIEKSAEPAVPVSPRVARTHAAVLAVAQQLLLERGPSDLTFSALSQRSGVTRQTLYRHWPTREALFADLVLTGPETDYPEPGGDVRLVTIAFLTSLRDGLAYPPRAAAILALAAAADRDLDSAAALKAIIDNRRTALNALLARTGRVIDEDEFAGLCGPILYRRLFSRAAVTDELIERTTNIWITPSR
jgi:AcrR family transcriptional regulator